MNRDFLKLAWRNIWRNKRRSYITISSVAFAVLLSSLMMSVQYGSMDHMVDNMVKFYTGHIQIHNNKYWNEKTIENSMSYDEQLIDYIAQFPEVASVVPRIESFALAAFGTKTKGSMILGIDPDKEKSIINVEEKLKKGKYFNADDKSVLVSTGLASYLGVQVGDSMVLFGQGYHGANAIGLYKISGLIKFPNPEQNNQTVCMPLKEAQWFYGMEKRLTSIAILVNSKEDMENAKSSINSLIGEKSIAAMDWGAMMPNLVQTVKLKHTSTEIMIMVLYVVIGFGMFGTFLMMTAERMREFGIMLSIGMHRRWLQFTVFIEIVMMSLMGVLAGIVMSLFAISYFHYNPPPMAKGAQAMADNYGIEAVFKFSMSPQLFIWQAWAIFIIGFLLSFYPILVLTKLSPVQAMREL